LWHYQIKILPSLFLYCNNKLQNCSKLLLPFIAFDKHRVHLTFEKQVTFGRHGSASICFAFASIKVYKHSSWARDYVCIYSDSRNERRDAENAPGRTVLCDLRRESISFGAHVPLVLSRPVLFLNPATYRVFKRTKRWFTIPYLFPKPR